MTLSLQPTHSHQPTRIVRRQTMPLFGHQPKPQPENTKEWLSDLFFPREAAPCDDHQCTDHNHEHENPELKNKNFVQKICLWFQELLGGFFKDLKQLLRLFTQDPKKPESDGHSHHH